MEKSFPKLDLVYFKMRAFTEAIQMQLCYGNVPYTYYMAWEYFDKPWPEMKKEIGFGQLPVLIVDNKTHIWQSGSIMRYTANLANTCPTNEEDRGIADAIFESSQELFQPLNATINFKVGEEYESLKKMILSGCEPKIFYFNKYLERDNSGPFFLGRSPTYCDFGTYHQLSMIRVLEPTIFDDWPTIKGFLSAIENLKGVSEYLDGRPELVGIKEKPKLIIKGKAVPTGMMPD
jgi:glutathione S-transferase